MKKFLLLIIVLVASIDAFAQYQVGDLYEKDGVPCVVIKVDDTGEHGTVMSLTWSIFYTQVMKDMNLLDADYKTVKKQGMKIASKANKLYSAYNKMAAPVISEVASSLSADGKANAEVIRAFCTEKGLDLATYFPEQAWAESLGEGWYIAGDNDLQDYSYVIGEGLGKELYPKGSPMASISYSKKFYAKAQALRDLCATTDGFQKAAVTEIVGSSTMTPGEKMAKRHYLCIGDAQTPIEYRMYRFIEETNLTGISLYGIPSTCACSEF